MKGKTISGHYDSTYSVEHNNRVFVPNNVDVARIVNNYSCIAVGQEAFPEGNRPVHISELWAQYKKVTAWYWEQRSLYQLTRMVKCRETLYELRKLCYYIWRIPHDPVIAFFKLLLLPLIIPCGIVATAYQMHAKEELESKRFEQWVRDIQFKAERASAREALKNYDVAYGTQLLESMDRSILSMAVWDNEKGLYTVMDDEDKSAEEERQPAKFATIEQIYEKCYEPAFRRYQEKQRPCRRYEGSYLEQLREKQQREAKKKGSKNEKSRTVAEAIEVVFGIGDMDNTGYEAAPEDAAKAEILLKDFCDHLLEDPHICYVTTRELDDPTWQPPFRNGLIVLNLTMHGDEATPGVHLTCIPYSRGCKRGPDVQASLGRAMTGMGYPSTWKTVLDENGHPVSKRDRDGNEILNEDGSIRYKQEPDKQGVLDWIEERKEWLSAEMQRRYSWEREYKGSHPRGNLTTPDYKIARAQERLAELNSVIDSRLQSYEARVCALTDCLEKAVSVNWEDALERDLILQYLMTCPEEQYEDFLNVAMEFLERLPKDEQAIAISSFDELLQEAKSKAKDQTISRSENISQERG